MPCSAPAGSWCWDRIPRWRRDPCDCVAAIGGDPARAVVLAGMMAVITGLVLILSGALRLGFVTELLSKPIRYGT